MSQSSLLTKSAPRPSRSSIISEVYAIRAGDIGACTAYWTSSASRSALSCAVRTIGRRSQLSVDVGNHG